MSTRIYGVKRDGVVVALVRASTPSQALAHMARSTWEAEPAKQDELVAALGGGIRVVDAAKPATQAAQS